MKYILDYCELHFCENEWWIKQDDENDNFINAYI